MMLDVFSGDAFSFHSLTDAINKLPYQPMRLGALKLFNEQGVRTTSIDIEEQSGRLSLIQSSPRGGVARDSLGAKKRTLRTFKAFHFERDTTVYADEVQGIRAFGSETELMQVEQLVSDRMAELVPMHEVTQEYHRVNAIQGLLLDADGSTLRNLFTDFGVAQQTADLELSDDMLDVRNAIIAAKRLSESELGGLFVSGYRAFCGAAFFDALIGHPQVQKSFQYQEGAVLRTDLRQGFRFGDVDFEEYRSGVARPDSTGGGTAQFIDTDEAYLVPAAPIFVTRFAPADYEEAVNTLGKPMYAKQTLDPTGLNKFRGINTQSNFITLCLRPRAVIKLTHS